jgi:DnaA family protein
VSPQLALNLRLRDGSSFGNFHGAGNREAVARLHALLAEPPALAGAPFLYLCGEHASGKTHLLEAACRRVQAHGRAPFYLPLGAAGLTPDVLEGAESAFLVCLDDVQRIAGDAVWERALFGLYEAARERGTRVVAAAGAAPARLGLLMPELATRLAAGPVYQLRPLNEQERLEAVRLRARNRGLDISEEVGRYILRRYPRDLGSLFALLERLDAAALASQRRITIPFLRALERG